MATTGNTQATVSGAMTALVTPFRGGEVDWARVETLVDRQVEGGIDWLVPSGTTGESPTLTSAEREKLLETVLSRSAGRCQVMAGTGTNDTASTVRNTKSAAAAGANAALLVTPYYNRPTPEGLFRHFSAVAESVELPLVLYNVPMRTATNLGNDVVVRLRERFPHVVALKDASGSVDGVTDLLARCDIAVLSGDDSLTLPMMATGAVGVISVIANLMPALMKSLVTAALGNNQPAALQYHRKVYDLAVGLARFGPNPIPIKTAMAITGLIEEEYRLPLCPVDVTARAEIEGLLRRHEIQSKAGA